MRHPINMLADDRERSSNIFQVLASMPDVTVDIQRLPVGDYQANDRLLFERKRLHDFAISVVDGRLFSQMTRLAISPLSGVLILEGRSHDLDGAGVRREALQGALITTSLILGIPVLRALEPEETAWLMIYAARQAGRIAQNGLQRSGYRPKGKRKRQLFILQGLPGVGPKRAARLLDRFGSVAAILNANAEKLSTVDGIGGNTARHIRWAVSEPVAAYGFDSNLILDL